MSRITYKTFARRCCKRASIVKSKEQPTFWLQLALLSMARPQEKYQPFKCKVLLRCA